MESPKLISESLAKLKEHVGLPVIGLEFIVEIVRQNGEYDYRCELCNEPLANKIIIDHVLTTKHRLGYLESFFPSAHSKFSSMPPDGSDWKKHNLCFLEFIVRKIESHFGRLQPLSVLEANLDASVVENIKHGPHFRESKELDFENLVSPFLPDKDSLDHIEDAKMQDFMKREIQRFREGQKVSSDAPYNKVNARLSALKDSLSEEERIMYEKHKAKGDTDDNLNEKRISNKLMKPFREIQSRLRKSPIRDSSPQSSHRLKRQTSPQDGRKRSRSKSPFEQQHRRWTKFRLEYQALESRSKRSHEIFIQRPEDHPSYPEEWGLFWERRYQELLDEGKDPDTHDFKQEWIPFWTKRSKELFNAELNTQKDLLLKKYDLETDDEPKRPDDEKSSSERKKERSSHQGRSPQSSTSEARSHPDRARSPRRRSRSRSRERRRSRSPAFRSRRSPDPKWKPQGRSPPGYPRRRSPSWHPNDQRGPRGSRPYSPEMHPGRRSRSPPMFPSSGSRSPRFFNRSRSPVEFFSNRSRSPTFHRSRSPTFHRSRSPTFHRGHSPAFHRSPSPGWQNNRGPSSLTRSPLGFNSRERSPGFSSSWDSPPRLRHPPKEKDILSRLGSSPPRRPPAENNGIIGVLRLLMALENSLGSLAPQVNALMARVMALENEKKGSSNRLLENPDIAAILEMAKEKLGGLVVSGLLADNQGLAARLCIDQLNEVLSNATRKRPYHLPDLTKKPEPETPPEETKEDQMKKLKGMFAEMLSKELLKRGQSLLTDQKLYKLVYEITKGTELDNGSLESPPPTPPPTPPPVVPEPPAVAHNPEMFIDIYDDLTCEELQAMLEGFEKLQKSEQLELIAYIKKLEKTDPQKLQKIKNPQTPAPVQKPPPPPEEPVQTPVQQSFKPSQQQNFAKNNWGTMPPSQSGGPVRPPGHPPMQSAAGMPRQQLKSQEGYPGNQPFNRQPGPQQMGQVRPQNQQGKQNPSQPGYQQQHAPPGYQQGASGYQQAPPGYQQQGTQGYQQQGPSGYQQQGPSGQQQQGPSSQQQQGPSGYQQQQGPSGYQQQGASGYQQLRSGYQPQGQTGYKNQVQGGYQQLGGQQQNLSTPQNPSQYGYQNQGTPGFQPPNPMANQHKPPMGVQQPGPQFPGQPGYGQRPPANFTQRPSAPQPRPGGQMNQPPRQQWNPKNPPLPADPKMEIINALAGPPPPPPPPPPNSKEQSDNSVPLVTSAYGYGTPKEAEITKGYTTYNYGKNQQTGYQTQNFTPQFGNPGNWRPN